MKHEAFFAFYLAALILVACYMISQEHAFQPMRPPLQQFLDAIKERRNNP